jgi:ribosome-associated heat shock protein Hsp15
MGGIGGIGRAQGGALRLRIDLCLSRLCLLKTRSQAGKACAEGRVLVNGEPARASREVRPGDRVLLRDRFGRYEEEVEILEIPRGPVSRSEARALVRRIARRSLEEGPARDDSGGPGPGPRP